MSEEGRFSIALEQRQGYQINVAFDWPQAPDLLLDGEPPLGECRGPNASRLLAAATADCLGASLLFCLFKDDPPAGCLRAEASCVMTRNAQKRMRIGQLEVRLIVTAAVTESPRFARCKDLFEEFCVVSASIRQGIPLVVTIEDEAGEVYYRSE
ncbi:OsmC family protein [Marichromatium bheemlicum]|uniref:OsmC family protein n=1 Tax=Marichromatium bheemlicum TaxID=365339 RepID=A0ABX1IAM8_9GAMM|nr:OsmC family protein [Marichromatium bheemlicum]NKN34588.1 OsmC family protein [Marichromatium bheemlicum]